MGHIRRSRTSVALQLSQQQRCPQGVSTCDLGALRQMTHSLSAAGAAMPALASLRAPSKMGTSSSIVARFLRLCSRQRWMTACSRPTSGASGSHSARGRLGSRRARRPCGSSSSSSKRSSRCSKPSVGADAWRPVSSSSATTPSANESTTGEHVPFMYSGAMYSVVPAALVVCMWVTVVPLAPWPSARATPKSPMRAMWARSRSRLAGLTSRWMTACACRCASPRTTSLRIVTRDGALRGPSSAPRPIHLRRARGVPRSARAKGRATTRCRGCIGGCSGAAARSHVAPGGSSAGRVGGVSPGVGGGRVYACRGSHPP
mmetsp:Transcript_51023/g.134993  ORF Transcript_51023/g.134993 Transcript_51023/m.134993 type:complete len:317 (-) Transcript_51023:652-1602(-)